MAVHFGFDCGDVVGRERAGLGEIEAQPIRRDERALLRHMPPKPMAERRVQQVGGGVVGADFDATRGVDREAHLVADADLASRGRVVDEELAERLGGIAHLCREAFAVDRPRVPLLAAALGVEGRLG